MINDENMIRLKKPDMFSLERTLDCGQAFRWESDESGIFFGRCLRQGYARKGRGRQPAFLRYEKR